MHPHKIAYFSMEIALEPDIPTYSGGLGVLSGDTVRSAADLSVPLVAVTLIYSGGYFHQLITPDGNQVEKPVRWDFLGSFQKIPEEITLRVQEKDLHVCAWKYDVKGVTGATIPVILLDTDSPENEPWQRNLTHALYDAHTFNRVVQELILGVGGTMMLQKLGYTNLDTYHLNEGHSAFLVFELLKKYKTIGEVKKHCVFTTHTPVEAGHERFDYEVVRDIFRDRLPEIVYSLAGKENLNMTKLALNSSRYINGVSRKHGEVSAMMFPGYQVKSITNGIHVNTWVSKHLEPVFDSKFGTSWRFDPACLDRAIEINEHEIWRAHDLAKNELLDYERSHSWVRMEKDVLTISYARRMTAYKRPMLIFTDLERLAKIARGKIQLIFAGKSHPADMNAKAMIKHLHEYSDTLWDSYRIKFAYLPNYDMDLDKMLTTGSDVWLNNPRRYNEASGTSGMKAALNGVLNFSTLDGWWIEGYEQDSLAGWAIGPGPSVPDADKLPDSADADALYKVLEDEIVPIWRKNIDDWKVRMKHAIKLAGYFNTNRMVEEYAVNAFRLKKVIPWTSA